MLILSRWLLEDIKDVKLLEKVDAVVVDDVVVLWLVIIKMLVKMALKLLKQYPKSIDKLAQVNMIFTVLLWTLSLTCFYEKMFYTARWTNI